MITKANFNLLLNTLDFSQKENVFSKRIHGFLIQADFNEEQLLYPPGVKIEGEFTTNFSSSENFVVFGTKMESWAWPEWRQSRYCY